jgi:hypothetical protein
MTVLLAALAALEALTLLVAWALCAAAARGDYVARRAMRRRGGNIR